MSVKYFKVRKLQKLLREVLRFYKTSPSLYNIFWLPHAFEIGFKCDHVCFLLGVCNQVAVSQVQQIVQKPFGVLIQFLSGKRLKSKGAGRTRFSDVN